MALYYVYAIILYDCHLKVCHVFVFQIGIVFEGTIVFSNVYDNQRSIKHYCELMMGICAFDLFVFLTAKLTHNLTQTNEKPATQQYIEH